MGVFYRSVTAVDLPSSECLVMSCLTKVENCFLSSWIFALMQAHLGTTC